MFSPSQILTMSINAVNNSERIKHIDFVRIIHYLAATNDKQEKRIKELESEVGEHIKAIRHLDKAIVALEKRVK